MKIEKVILAANNGAIAIPGYGTKPLVVETVEHGLVIMAEESASRMRRTYYQQRTYTDSFDIAVACLSYAHYAELASWLQGYGKRLADIGGNLGPARVTVPSRQFDKVGVLTSGVTFGDSRPSVVYRMRLTFIAAGDLQSVASNFKLPSGDTFVAPFYYPAGTQNNANGGGDFGFQYNEAIDMAAATAKAESAVTSTPPEDFG